MTEVFVVYYGPQGRNLGAFPSKEEANNFIDAWLLYWWHGDPNEERAEFSIEELAFKPNAADCEL
jgi:hypothetical protein